MSASSLTVTAVTGQPQDAQPDAARLMTAAEVCQLLNISKSTLAAWRDAGALEAVPLPMGTWRYPSSQETVQRALAALGRAVTVYVP